MTTTHPHRAVAALLAALLCLCMVAPVAAATPRERVEAFNEALLGAMRAGEAAGFSGRRALLEPILRDTFDLPFIARLALGGHARELDAAALQDFVDRFSEMVVATYASRFDGYSGQRIDVTEVRELRAERQLVRTELVDPDGDRVNLDYVLHQRDGAWRVVNVVANGVSDLSVRRAEYGAIISREGYAVLLSRLDDQIALLSR